MYIDKVYVIRINSFATSHIQMRLATNELTIWTHCTQTADSINVTKPLKQMPDHINVRAYAIKSFWIPHFNNDHMQKHKTCTSNLLNLPLPTRTAKINNGTIIKMHVHVYSLCHYPRNRSAACTVRFVTDEMHIMPAKLAHIIISKHMVFTSKI